jgi:hypothetical protein
VVIRGREDVRSIRGYERALSWSGRVLGVGLPCAGAVPDLPGMKSEVCLDTDSHVRTERHLQSEEGAAT